MRKAFGKWIGLNMVSQQEGKLLTLDTGYRVFRVSSDKVQPYTFKRSEPTQEGGESVDIFIAGLDSEIWQEPGNEYLHETSAFPSPIQVSTDIDNVAYPNSSNNQMIYTTIAFLSQSVSLHNPWPRTKIFKREIWRK